MCTIDATPFRDVNGLGGGGEAAVSLVLSAHGQLTGRDHRTLDKLADGVTSTCDDVHMWLAPFSPGKEHLLTIKLPQPETLKGLRVWNYNKSLDDSYRGVGAMRIKLDGVDLLGRPVTVSTLKLLCRANKGGV